MYRFVIYQSAFLDLRHQLEVPKVFLLVDPNENENKITSKSNESCNMKITFDMLNLYCFCMCNGDSKFLQM